MALSGPGFTGRSKEYFTLLGLARFGEVARNRIEVFKALAKVWERAYSAHTGRPMRFREWDEFELIATLASTLVLAHEGDVLVGGAMLTPEDPPADVWRPSRNLQIAMVCVEPTHWDRRVGRGIIEHALATAANMKSLRADLWVSAFNERALRLYSGAGFRATGSRRTGTDGGAELQYAISVTTWSEGPRRLVARPDIVFTSL